MRSKSVSEIILIRLIDSALTRFAAPSKTIFNFDSMPGIYISASSRFKNINPSLMLRDRLPFRSIT